MKRDIEWKERIEGGVKRTVRIKFPGNGAIKWQFLRSDYDGDNPNPWDYDTPPSTEDWDNLIDLVNRMYIRNRCAHHDLELVKKARWDAYNAGR